MKSQYIGIDFDGTMVDHKYPEIGQPLEGAIDVVKELISAGHKLILYTMRNNERLAQAVEYLEENDLEFYAVNDNPSQKYWAADSRKIFCNIYIDDSALGVPLNPPRTEKGRPSVNWEAVRELLVAQGHLE